MLKDLNYELGDIATMRKPHPCGSDKWEIIRMGADIKIKCCGCGHVVCLNALNSTKAQKKQKDQLLNYSMQTPEGKVFDFWRYLFYILPNQIYIYMK